MERPGANALATSRAVQRARHAKGEPADAQGAVRGGMAPGAAAEPKAGGCGRPPDSPPLPTPPAGDAGPRSATEADARGKASAEPTTAVDRERGSSQELAVPSAAPHSASSRPRQLRLVRVAHSHCLPLRAPPELRRVEGPVGTDATRPATSSAAVGNARPNQLDSDSDPDVYYIDPPLERGQQVKDKGGRPVRKKTKEKEQIPVRSSPRCEGDLESSPSSEEVVCNICHTEFNEGMPRGEIECACVNINFCFKCISRWAQECTECPFCKTVFGVITEVTRKNGIDTRVQHQVEPRTLQAAAEDPEDEMLEDAYANTYCFVCGQDRDDHLLLLCETCEAGAHTYCIGLGNHVPEAEFHCPDCLGRTHEEFLEIVQQQLGNAAPQPSPDRRPLRR